MYINNSITFVMSASVSVVAMPIAAVLVGMLMEAIGRKRTIQASYLPLTVGWAIIALAPSVGMICIGRVITGCAIGKSVIFKYSLIK